MRIALDHQPLLLDPGRIATKLAPRDEELLGRREAIDRRAGRLLLGLHERAEREVAATGVADRFAEHELAVVVHTRLDEVALELLGDALALGLELREVVLGPPVLEPALGVEL